MNREYAKYLLYKTTDEYNKIAEQFSSTRNYLSSDIIALKKYALEGDNILDLGCGNGRLTELFTGMKISYVGGDSSNELIKIARKRYPRHKFISLNPIELPFADATFDLVYCLSVFHHIPSTELRIQYLKEIRRVMKEKSLLVLTVWNLWKKNHPFWSIIRDGIFHPFLDLNDIFLPFKDQNGKVLAERYIHSFKKTELEKLFLEAGFNIHIIESQVRGRKEENENFLVVASK